ncbi:MAG: hypothetical protein EXQ56_02900 [Acidobacteria bacterium]|nr:hypothetical protein [Acidobacteriota bacterium]
MKSLIPQYGIGIELRKNSLVAIFAKRTMGSFRIVDRLELKNMYSDGPVICGQEYTAFLRRHGLRAPWTIVSIPRETAILRDVKLPGTVAHEVKSVIGLQLESLHPFADEDVVWDCMIPTNDETQQRGADSMGRPINVTVAFAQRKAVLELAEWFNQAGIPVSQFVISPLLLRTIADQSHQSNADAAEPVVVAYSKEDGWDLIGCASGHPTVVRELSIHDYDADNSNDLLAALDNELDTVCATLRVEKTRHPCLLIGGAISSKTELWSTIEKELGQRYQLTQLDADCLAIAAARSAFGRGEDMSINLLPPEQRHFESPGALIPTYSVAAVVLLLVAGLGFRGTLQDWQYSRRLDSEIVALHPRVSEIEKMRDQSGTEYHMLLRLAAIRDGAKLPLDMLEEVTRSLPADAWLQQLQLEGNTLTLVGVADSASSVLQAISETSRIESPQFLSAISRSNDGKEAFRIGARLRPGIR